MPLPQELLVPGQDPAGLPAGDPHQLSKRHQAVLLASHGQPYGNVPAVAADSLDVRIQVHDVTRDDPDARGLVADHHVLVTVGMRIEVGHQADAREHVRAQPVDEPEPALAGQVQQPRQVVDAHPLLQPVHGRRQADRPGPLLQLAPLDIDRGVGKGRHVP